MSSLRSRQPIAYNINAESPNVYITLQVLIVPSKPVSLDLQRLDRIRIAIFDVFVVQRGPRVTAVDFGLDAGADAQAALRERRMLPFKSRRGAAWVRAAGLDEPGDTVGVVHRLEGGWVRACVDIA